MNGKQVSEQEYMGKWVKPTAPPPNPRSYLHAHLSNVCHLEEGNVYSAPFVIWVKRLKHIF